MIKDKTMLPVLKKQSTWVLVMMLLIILVNAEQGGGGIIGGGRLYCYDKNFCSGDYNICNITTGNCEINMSSFTGCLIKNCDYFCKKIGKDSGKYYHEDKCWCEIYSTSSKGKVILEDGWIQITECRLNENSLIRIIIIVLSILILILVLISILYIVISQLPHNKLSGSLNKLGGLAK